MHREAELDPVLILEGLRAIDHRELVTHLSYAKSYLRNALPSDKHVEGIVESIIDLAKHSKWEVKMAVAEVLGCVDLRKVKDTLEMLSKEPVRYVQNAAKKALLDSKRITTKISEKRDPTADRLFELIRKMNPRNVREAYAAAMQVGQIYYRELAAVTTHELRNYLNILCDFLDNLEYLLDSHPVNNATEIVEKARQTMQELIETIDRLSFISKVFGPDVAFEVVPVIEEAMQEARAKVRQDGHECKDIRYTGPHNDVKLKGDRIPLKVALRNLVINAIEASPADEIVDIKLDVGCDSLNICVQDRGSGMTEQEITSSFKFFTTTKKESDGRGLGVPIAQKVIYFDFGGEIRYESEIGKGTRVLVELPINKENT